MSKINLQENFSRIFESIEATGNKRTTVAKFMGYTTTAQLNSVLDGTSVLSTKAIISLIENLDVNPSYLFLGKGNMLLNEMDKDEIVVVKQSLERAMIDFTDALKREEAYQKRIQELEKANADLLEMSSAALKYYKSKYEEDSKNQAEK
jgi:hypothetical protein